MSSVKCWILSYFQLAFLNLFYFHRTWRQYFVSLQDTDMKFHRDEADFKNVNFFVLCIIIIFLLVSNSDISICF